MRPKRYFTLIAIMAFVMLLSGCGSRATPTIDPAIQQATIDAAVAQALQTLMANQTSTAAAMPTNTSTATNTPEPTFTFTTSATATPFIPTATWIPYTLTPSATATPVAYSCQLLSTSPTAGTKININTDYDAAWVVKNNGTKVWEIGYFDLKFISGTKMQTKGDIFDVKTAVDKGGEIKLIVDMKTPSTAGKYTATWALMLGEQTLCTLPVDIEAVNP